MFLRNSTALRKPLRRHNQPKKRNQHGSGITTTSGESFPTGIVLGPTGPVSNPGKPYPIEAAQNRTTSGRVHSMGFAA